jgi:hypothetical protein
MLPLHWIDRIFDKLTLTYGKAFALQYDGMDIDAVKANWSHELAGFHDKPDCIKHALQNLPPDRPPNVLQFRAICQKSPLPVFKALPAPVATIDVKAKIAELKKILTSPLDQRKANHAEQN